MDGKPVEGVLDRIHFVRRTLRTTGVVDPPDDVLPSWPPPPPEPPPPPVDPLQITNKLKYPTRITTGPNGKVYVSDWVFGWDGPGKGRVYTFYDPRHQATEAVESAGRIMAQGIANGELRGELDPNTVARAFIAYQNGVATLWLTNRQAFSLAEQAADFADIFMTGLATR